MELDETTMGIIGILAGILILSGWVPQIIRGYRTKKLNDVSDMMKHHLVFWFDILSLFVEPNLIKSIYQLEFQ